MTRSHQFSRKHNSNWCLWILTGLFGILIIVKNLLFHQFCFDENLLTAEIWTNSLVRESVLLPKLSVSLFFVGLVLLTPRKFWTLIFLFLYDTWCVANLVYYRSTMSVIDITAISMVGNMSGFWDSVWFLLSWKDTIFYGLTLLYCIGFYFLNTSQTKWKYSVVAFVVSYGMTLMGIYCMTKRWGRDLEMFYEPISKLMRRTISGVDYTLNVREFSLIHSWGFMMLDFLEIEQSKYEISDDERSEVAALIGDENYVTFDDKLVIILVESLEDWAVNPVSMPHLYDFIKKHPRIWAHRISKQTLNGASSDGQLIINTGLLPISQGATCYLFPSNKYPSIAACCPNPSATIIPHEPTVWNQHYMSRSFGYDTTVVMTPNDSLLAQKTIDMLHEGYQMVQVITMASHIPFTYGASRSNLKLPASMPRFMADYMKSLHYTDEGLSLLFDAIDNDSTLFNTTIVITGDHTIFYSDQRYEYDLYCQQAGFNYAVTEAYCPLIIHSAKRILHDIDINQVAFQMDIYPTIMSLIGCKNYYWSGLGIDLSDTTKGLNRIVTEQQAYYMSNLLIRSNYFSN